MQICNNICTLVYIQMTPPPLTRARKVHTPFSFFTKNNIPLCALALSALPRFAKSSAYNAKEARKKPLLKFALPRFQSGVSGVSGGLPPRLIKAPCVLQPCLKKMSFSLGAHASVADIPGFRASPNPLSDAQTRPVKVPYGKLPRSRSNDSVPPI